METQIVSSVRSPGAAPDAPAEINEMTTPLRNERPSGRLEIVEFELSLDAFDVTRNGFAETVSAAARAVGGDYLFSLPAAGLADGCQKIAAVRLPGSAPGSLLFVFLGEDGTRMEVRPPDDETSALARFSTAFVEVLERL